MKFNKILVLSLGLLISMFAANTEAKSIGSIGEMSHQEPGVIRGAVSDLSGARIGNATVQITGMGGKLFVVTDSEGTYQVNLQAGTYDIEVRRRGFFPYTEKEVIIQPGAIKDLNVNLKVSDELLCILTVTPEYNKGKKSRKPSTKRRRR